MTSTTRAVGPPGRGMTRRGLLTGSTAALAAAALPRPAYAAGEALWPPGAVEATVEIPAPLAAIRDRAPVARLALVRWWDAEGAQLAVWRMPPAEARGLLARLEEGDA